MPRPATGSSSSISRQAGEWSVGRSLTTCLLTTCLSCLSSLANSRQTLQCTVRGTFWQHAHSNRIQLVCSFFLIWIVAAIHSVSCCGLCFGSFDTNYQFSSFSMTLAHTKPFPVFIFSTLFARLTRYPIPIGTTHQSSTNKQTTKQLHHFSFAPHTPGALPARGSLPSSKGWPKIIPIRSLWR